MYWSSEKLRNGPTPRLNQGSMFSYCDAVAQSQTNHEFAVLRGTVGTDTCNTSTGRMLRAILSVRRGNGV